MAPRTSARSGGTATALLLSSTHRRASAAPLTLHPGLPILRGSRMPPSQSSQVPHGTVMTDVRQRCAPSCRQRREPSPLAPGRNGWTQPGSVASSGSGSPPGSLPMIRHASSLVPPIISGRANSEDHAGDSAAREDLAHSRRMLPAGIGSWTKCFSCQESSASVPRTPPR